MKKTDQTAKLNKMRYGLWAVSALLILAVLVLVLFWINFRGREHTTETALTTPVSQKAELQDLVYFREANFKTDRIKDSTERAFVEYGKDLITKTSTLIGPNVEKSAMRFSGNNLNCSSCHLDGGTRPYAAPFIGVWGSYPNFRKRENTLGTLEDRVNGCMERSMNGKKLPVDGKEMKAILAYIKFLNKNVPVKNKIEGQGFASINAPDRPADIQKGQVVYAQQCARCHGEKGRGLRNGKPGDAKGYLYPPLWGNESFNDGAGMHRVLTAARFIKANMPYGTPVGKPVLTDEEAYDVAAYINSFPRPEKANKEKDYPNLKLKPQDCPYPPYADTLSIEQHQLGPYVMN